MPEPKLFETRTVSYYPKHHTITYLPEEIETVIGIKFEDADIVPADAELPVRFPQRRVWQKVHGYKGDSWWIEIYPDLREAITLYRYSLFHRLNLQSLATTVKRVK